MAFKEYWIVIPQKSIIEIYKNPIDDGYAQKNTYTIDDNWTMDQFELSVKGGDFLIES